MSLQEGDKYPAWGAQMRAIKLLQAKKTVTALKILAEILITRVYTKFCSYPKHRTLNATFHVISHPVDSLFHLQSPPHPYLLPSGPTAPTRPRSRDLTHPPLPFLAFYAPQSGGVLNSTWSIEHPQRKLHLYQLPCWLQWHSKSFVRVIVKPSLKLASPPVSKCVFHNLCFESTHSSFSWDVGKTLDGGLD